jgi:hypothetical protein
MFIFINVTKNKMKIIKNLQFASLQTVVALVFMFVYVQATQAAPNLPEFDADNFSNPTIIDNPWFTLTVGREFEYRGETDDGTEAIKIEITGDTKIVMDINALVYRDVVWVDGEIVEDTRDYLAQDNDGNVWYLGEEVDNYEDGKIVNHDGSWLAGVDGALPGYWMKADPKVGDYYKQEFYEGEAEDEAKVLSTTENVKTELGTYNNCLKIQDIVPNESMVEYKYYCKKVGGLVLEEKPKDGERIELVEYGTDDGVSDTEEDEYITAKMQTLINLLNQLLALLRSQYK